MAATSQIAVSDSTPTAVVTLSPCTQVRITENRGVAGWPTSDFLIYKPTLSATPVRIQAGAQYTFENSEAAYAVGRTVGYVKMVAGSTTFDQDEST